MSQTKEARLKCPVEWLIEGLDGEERHRVFFSHLTYPRTADEIYKQNPPQCTCTYSCQESLCDFKSALKCVEESVELRAICCQKVAKALVTDIQENQDDYAVLHMDGFQLKRANINALSLVRVKDNSVDSPSGRTGVLEFNELRRMAATKRKAQHDALLYSSILPALINAGKQQQDDKCVMM